MTEGTDQGTPRRRGGTGTIRLGIGVWDKVGGDGGDGVHRAGHIAGARRHETIRLGIGLWDKVGGGGGRGAEHTSETWRHGGDPPGHRRVGREDGGAGAGHITEVRRGRDAHGASTAARTFPWCRASAWQRDDHCISGETFTGARQIPDRQIALPAPVDPLGRPEAG